MPVVFGEMVSSVEEVVRALKRHGGRMRGTYRAHYRFDPQTRNPYAAPRLERPECLREESADIVYPWEQVFLAAAACAGSDYPMFASHLGIALDGVELVLEGEFDPRDEFSGFDDFEAPADARHCYLALHVRVTLDSSAPRGALDALHARVMRQNMVLGALRGVPQTSELAVRAVAVGGRNAAAAS